MFESNAEKAQKRKLEEKLYNEVAQELKQGKKHDATWAKALAHAKGNSGTAQGVYIEYRVQSLMDNIIIEQENQKIHLEQKNLKVKEASRKQVIKQGKKQGKKVLDGFTVIMTWLVTVMIFIVIGTILNESYDTDETIVTILVFIIGIPTATILSKKAKFY